MDSLSFGTLTKVEGWQPGFPETVLDVKLCNCAGCNREILGESMLDIPKNYLRTLFAPNHVPWRLAARLNGRPYCRWCKHYPKDIEPLRYSPYGLPKDYATRKPKPRRIYTN